MTTTAEPIDRVLAAVTATRYVLWGSRPDRDGGRPIRLERGSLRACMIEQLRRRREGGWSLAVCQAGEMPQL